MEATLQCMRVMQQLAPWPAALSIRCRSPRPLDVSKMSATVLPSRSCSPHTEDGKAGSTRPPRLSHSPVEVVRAALTHVDMRAHNYMLICSYTYV